MKNYEMGETCSMLRKNEKYIKKIWSGNFKKRDHMGKPRSGWKNIKMDLSKMVWCEGWGLVSIGARKGYNDGR
jgi:hypothetical protein